MSIASRLDEIRSTLPTDGSVTLVAVSKFHPAEAIAGAYAAGQRDFGESRAQELVVKAPALPADIRWHFIGHLQTNKVRQVVAHASMIQSVDSLRLLQAINAESVRIGRTVDILLEAHVAAEQTKTGFSPDELMSLLTDDLIASLPGVCFRGIMGMASLTDDIERIRSDFEALRDIFLKLRCGVMETHPEFNVLSMGMSDDYLTAIESGSTMVRIGTDIFGPREY